MSTPTYYGEVQLLGWTESNTQGMCVRFRLHPDDAGQTHPFREFTAGERFAVVIAPFSESEDAAPDPAPAGTPKRHWDELPLSQQAALRCNDERFHLWFRERLRKYPGSIGTAEAAEIVRERCGVKSRAELDANPAAAARWRTLDAEFRLWAGMTAEER